MILTVIVGVLAVAAISWAGYLQYRKAEFFSEGDAPSVRVWWGLAGVMLLLAIISTGLRIIPAGHVGVVTFFGEVEDRTLQPGLQFVAPIAEGIIEVETRVRGVGFENLGAASSEYQDVLITGTLNIHVDGAEADELYQDVGLDYEGKIVTPFLATLVKEIVPEYDIDQILLKREEIRTRAVQSLGAKLAPYHIVVDDLAFSQISFSEAYTNAIEDKQVQEQRVLTEQQILEQKRIQAEQAVVAATGEADANIETARGQAEANRLLTESLSPILVQWQAIQKLNPNIKIALVPSGNGFILDIGGLINEPGPTVDPNRPQGAGE